MLSRIFWVGIAGVALIAGMVIQNGDRIFAVAAESESLASVERSIDATVEEAVAGSFDKMQVIDADGNEIDVPAETKQAMAEAVGRLVKAEADLAILRVRDGSAEDRQAAETRRAEARAEVDRLKAVMRNEEQGAKAEQQALSEQIERDVRQEVREDIRAAVREAVRN